MTAADPTFVGATRGEIGKLCRQAMVWGLLAAGVLSAGPLMVAGIVRWDAPARYVASLSVASQGTYQYAMGLTLLLAAARLMGMEFSAGTLRVLLARGVGRPRLLAAKVTALCLLGLIVLAVFEAAALATAVISTPLLFHSPDALRAVPWTVWANFGLEGLAEMATIAACVAVGFAGAVLGRSLAFGLVVAAGFFPAESFVVPLAYTIGRPDLVKVTDWLLGRNLETLSHHLRIGPPVGYPNTAGPLSTAGAEHAAIVVLVYVLALGALSAALFLRRDVRE